jgi:PAS domain S-box-containing protein
MNKSPRSGVRSQGGNGRPVDPGTARPRASVESEPHKYLELFEQAVFGVFQTTPEGRFVDANDALARILGYDSRDDLINTVSDIGGQLYVEPEKRAEFSRQLQEQGAVHGFEAQVYRKDGTTIWISLTGRLTGNGTDARHEGIIEEITDRKAVEESLRSSEERFYKAFHASPAAKSIVTAQDRRFIDVNDHFLAILATPETR